MTETYYYCMLKYISQSIIIIIIGDHVTIKIQNYEDNRFNSS